MPRPLPPTVRLLGGGLLVAVLALAALLTSSVTAAQRASPTAAPACPPATPIPSPTTISATVVATLGPMPTTAASPEVATPTAAGCIVTINMVDIKFVPNDVTLPANIPVHVILHNLGALPHNFSVTAHNNPHVKNLNISVDVAPGQTKDLTITAPAGNYYFYCDVPGHEAAGMHGMLHVRAAPDS